MVSLTILANISVFKSLKQYRIELFNEVILMNLLYCILCFSDYVTDVEAQFKVGYVASTLVLLNFLVNLMLITITSLKGLIHKIRMRNYRNLIFEQKLIRNVLMAETKADRIAAWKKRRADLEQ